MRNLRAEFLQVLATFRQGICIPPGLSEEKKQQLDREEIQEQKVFLEYIKYHIRDLEDQLNQREAGVSPLANTSKLGRNKKIVLVRAPKALEPKD